MFGFVIGALSLFGLVKVLRAGRGYRRMGACGGRGWGGHGWGGHGGHGWGAHGGHGWGGHGGWGHHGGHHGWGRDGGHEGRGWGGWQERGRNAFGLRWIFQTLDTTPGQEKVIRQAYDEVREAMQAGRGELDASRREIAAAIRAGNIDETQMGALYARHDEALRTLRTTFFGALAKVTEALDEDQRRVLADLLDRQGGGFFGGGPYRN